VRRFLILIGYLLLLLELGCHARHRQVVIGIAISPSQHAAVELAVREINASGGVRGVPLKLMGLEWNSSTQLNAREVVAWAKRFADEPDLVAVIGHSDSAATLSSAGFYNQRKIPQIVTVATNAAITNIGEWTYRLCISDSMQGPALAAYAVNKLNKKRIAVFYVNDDYGRGLDRSFEEAARHLGAEIVASTMHRNTLETDDQELIRRLLERMKRETPPQLIVLFQRTDAAYWTIQEINHLGLQTDLLGGDSLGESRFLESTQNLKTRIQFSQFFFPQPGHKAAAEFVRKFRESTQSDPDYGQAFAYDAVYLIRDAVQAKGFSREAVKAYLDQLIRDHQKRDGVTGEYVLNRDHDAQRAIYIVEVHNGQEQLVDQLPFNQ
jgi:branched-chain amino acid transport system substrate-binding protein